MKEFKKEFLEIVKRAGTWFFEWSELCDEGKEDMEIREWVCDEYLENWHWDNERGEQGETIFATYDDEEAAELFMKAKLKRGDLEKVLKQIQKAIHDLYKNYCFNHLPYNVDVLDDDLLIKELEEITEGPIIIEEINSLVKPNGNI